MPVYQRLSSVADIPRLHAKERPGAIALDFKGRLTTYGELDARANRVAQGLDRARPEARRARGLYRQEYATAISRCCSARSRRRA